MLPADDMAGLGGGRCGGRDRDRGHRGAGDVQQEEGWVLWLALRGRDEEAAEGGKEAC